MHLPLTQSFSLLRIKELVKKLGVARSTIYDWMNPKSPRHDPYFPQRIHIGAAAVRWDEGQVDAWIQRKRSLCYSTEIDGYTALGKEEGAKTATNYFNV